MGGEGRGRLLDHGVLKIHENELKTCCAVQCSSFAELYTNGGVLACWLPNSLRAIHPCSSLLPAIHALPYSVVPPTAHGAPPLHWIGGGAYLVTMSCSTWYVGDDIIFDAYFHWQPPKTSTHPFLTLYLLMKSGIGCCFLPCSHLLFAPQCNALDL